MSKSIPLYHLELVRDRSIPFSSVIKTEERAEVLHNLLDRSPVEQLVVLYVDAGGNLVGAEKVGLGSLTYVSVTLKEIFRGAILASAPHIVLGHNHPNDDTTPSNEDWSLTTNARRMGEQLGIDVLDHIIVGPSGKHTSMREQEESEMKGMAGRVMDRMLTAINTLPPLDQEYMKNRMKSYGLNPNILPRDKDAAPEKPLMGLPPGSTLADMLRDSLNSKP